MGITDTQAVASVDTLGLTEPVQQDRQYFEYATYAALAVNALVILFTLLIAPRVKIAVACLKVASQAVGHMPSLMLFPVLPFVCELALLTWFIMVSALLYRCVPTPGFPCTERGAARTAQLASKMNATFLSWPHAALSAACSSTPSL
jgi:hypothetical protein